MGITNSVDGRTHIIKCDLAKDAGRIYRLDGKLKTGKDVKASAAYSLHTEFTGAAIHQYPQTWVCAL